MPIPFKDDTDVADLKQTAFNLLHCDMREMDAILDPLAREECIEWVPLGHPSPASSPAFVVYCNEKARVIVNLRRVYYKLLPDAYPLPKPTMDDLRAMFHRELLYEEDYQCLSLGPLDPKTQLNPDNED
ncbi:hypothetical protein GX50_03678 [[Emmonsia] crescens]|uniref:Uncharacterized protein n=1 Tax=[Emmonsia] crescens TaxID=73230 RepID=A0A2B7ZJJ3_9EURO|nr:hypothetical protein GX50_03678 [Emmonsia crescens]